MRCRVAASMPSSWVCWAADFCSVRVFFMAVPSALSEPQEVVRLVSALWNFWVGKATLKTLMAMRLGAPLKPSEWTMWKSLTTWTPVGPPPPEPNEIFCVDMAP